MTSQTQTTIFIKPMTWAGTTAYYLGFAPSRPTADLCNRLGSYFLRLDSHFSARCVADSEAARMTKLGRPTTVAECPAFVGL